jgi:integrase
MVSASDFMVSGRSSVLTDLKLRSAKPQAKPYKLSDGHQLYLLVAPSGSKLWRMNYSYDAKQKTLAIGPYPLIVLGEARAKRDEARKLLLEGKDPGVEKRLKIDTQLASARNTFEKIARAWHELSRPHWAKVHAGDVLRSLERDVFPSIGNLPIAAIKAPKVLEVLRAIEERPAIETAKRVRQRISAVFVYAIAAGIADHDPAGSIGAALKPLPKKGKRPAIIELAAVRRMLGDAEEGYARPVTRLGHRLLALTSVRPGELRHARWEEFEGLDGDEPLWRIPAVRMKGDKDRKEEVGGDHLVPLTWHSVEVLKTLHPLTGNGTLLFPSARHAHRPMSENAIGYLLNRVGYHGHHVPHGWRAAFSTIMNEWAKRDGRADDREVIDLMLAHIPENKIEGAYNRAAYMLRRRELAQIWADMLMKDTPSAETLMAKACKIGRPWAPDDPRRARSEPYPQKLAAAA